MSSYCTSESTIDEAIKMLQPHIAIYNKRRGHMALKYKAPDEAHQAL